MALKDALAHIDEQIASLQHARAIIAGTASAAEVATPKPGRGRPKGSKNAATASAPAAAKKGKRQLSPEGRKAIADAMKRRWAEKRTAK
jgi:hypothetical protein